MDSLRINSVKRKGGKVNKETKDLARHLLGVVNSARIDCILEPEKYGDNLESWLFEIESDLTDFLRTNMHREAVR